MVDKPVSRHMTKIARDYCDIRPKVKVFFLQRPTSGTSMQACRGNSGVKQVTLSMAPDYIVSLDCSSVLTGLQFLEYPRIR